MFLFKWFASSAVIYYFTRNVALSALGGFFIAAVDSLIFGDRHVVVTA